jgi:hypothetical protein
MKRFELAIICCEPICVAPHNAVQSQKDQDVKVIENATSMVLAIAAQALAVGIVLAL